MLVVNTSYKRAATLRIQTLISEMVAGKDRGAILESLASLQLRGVIDDFRIAQDADGLHFCIRPFFTEWPQLEFHVAA